MLNLKSFHSEEITKSIEKYNLDKVSVVFDSDQKNTIIFFQGKSKDLVKNSKGLTSISSEYIYDAEFEKEINAYNIYMVFLATDTFSFEDFIKIRSNTFFSKKIILNNYAGNLEDDKENLVNRYILHNNIDLNSLSLDVIKDNLSEMPNDYQVKDNLNDAFAIHLFKNLENNYHAPLNLGNIDEYINASKGVRLLVIMDVLKKLILKDKYKINFSTTNENFQQLFQMKHDKFIRFNIDKTNIIANFLEKELFEISLIDKSLKKV